MYCILVSYYSLIYLIEAKSPSLGELRGAAETVLLLSFCPINNIGHNRTLNLFTTEIGLNS